MKPKVTLSYKSLMDYGFIAEQLTDYQLQMFTDGIENHLAMNYGTASFAFSRIKKQFRQRVNEFIKHLDRLIDEGAIIIAE